MKGLGIIQARMGSERFNGKSLLTIGDEKVIYHCYRAAIKSEVFRSHYSCYNYRKRGRRTC